MKKYVKIALLVIVALIFIGTFVFLYQKSQPKASVYTILNAEITDLKKTTVATGKIEPRDEILIKPQISGIIDEVYKEAGQKIKKGEVIAKVKVIPELGQLNSAESRVRLAEINARQGETDFARMKKLFESKLISSEEYEKSEVAVKQAREELQTAKDNLEIVKEGITKNKASFSSTLIRSTIDGLILDVPVKAGNSVIMSNTFNDGTTIATVANMNDLIFRGNIDETEVGRIHEGMPVKITLGALQNMEFDAQLEYISPKGVEENGANQFEIKAAITVPDSITIRSGYSANAEIVLARASKVLAVPESTQNEQDTEQDETTAVALKLSQRALHYDTGVSISKEKSEALKKMWLDDLNESSRKIVKDKIFNVHSYIECELVEDFKGDCSKDSKVWNNIDDNPKDNVISGYTIPDMISDLERVSTIINKESFSERINHIVEELQQLKKTHDIELFYKIHQETHDLSYWAINYPLEDLKIAPADWHGIYVYFGTLNDVDLK